MSFLSGLFKGPEEPAQAISQQTPVKRGGAPGRVTIRRNSHDSVDGASASKVPTVAVECGNEDTLLTYPKRLKLIAQMRDLVRNHPTSKTLDKQRRVNIVGAVGGNLQFTTIDQDFNVAAGAYFRRWARCCEFTDRKSFNHVLKNAISALDNEGDFVIVYDDPATCPIIGSGKIAVFAADEIGPLSKDDFQSFADQGYRQAHGRIYDRFGRFCGVILSKTCKGKFVYPRDKALVFTCDPSEDIDDQCWVYVSNTERENQGRGLPEACSSIFASLNLKEVDAYEIDAVKANSAIMGQIVRSAEEQAAEKMPDAYRALPGISDQAAFDQAGPSDQLPPGVIADEDADFEDAPQDIDLSGLTSKGAKIVEMPAGYDIKMLDFNRPNVKTMDFIDRFLGIIAASRGMGAQYATLNPSGSYSAFRGSQVLARPIWESDKKDLERAVCDWVAYHVILTAVASGGLPMPPDGWQRSLFWSWPEPIEVDEKSSQEATRLKLSNGTTTFKAVHGPDWRNVVEQIGEEVAACRAAGIVHPATAVVGGSASAPEPANNNGDEE